MSGDVLSHARYLILKLILEQIQVPSQQVYVLRPRLNLILRDLSLVLLLVLFEDISQVGELLLTRLEHSLDLLIHYYYGLIISIVTLTDPFLGLVAEERDLLSPLLEPFLARVESGFDGLGCELKLIKVPLVLLD